eukprot:NODE_250_length_2387_cov_14.941403_g196_i0.p1 GENE.NODE_250_length_2387_cov_14.941403_g196_i0~~NODE_250_length_2387_cov_14.941403_g196_i0.p1  ORF type:complete len:777 (-),score=189.69 NODE_250_length_2387_cov_14.941403_g196_i0:55-2385(-)
MEMKLDVVAGTCYLVGMSQADPFQDLSATLPSPGGPKYRLYNVHSKNFEEDDTDFVQHMKSQGWRLKPVEVATYRRFKLDTITRRVVEDPKDAVIVVPDYDGLSWCRDRFSPYWIVKPALSLERNTQLLVKYFLEQDLQILTVKSLPTMGLVQPCDPSIVEEVRTLTDWKQNHGWESNNTYKTQELSVGHYVAFWSNGDMELLKTPQQIFQYYTKAWRSGRPLPLNPNWPVSLEDNGMPVYDPTVPKIDIKMELEKFREKLENIPDSIWTMAQLQNAYDELFPGTQVQESMNVMEHHDKLPPQKLILLRELFKEVDVDGSGQIEIAEVKSALMSTGAFGHTDDSHLDAVIREIDIDGSGDITFDEFCHLMLSVNPALVPNTTQFSFTPVSCNHRRSLIQDITAELSPEDPTKEKLLRVKGLSKRGSSRFGGIVPVKRIDKQLAHKQDVLPDGACLMKVDDDPIFAEYASFRDEQKLLDQYFILKRIEFLPPLILCEDDLSLQMDHLSPAEMKQYEICSHIVSTLISDVKKRVHGRRFRMLRDWFWKLGSQVQVFEQKYQHPSRLEDLLWDFYRKHLLRPQFTDHSFQPTSASQEAFLQKMSDRIPENMQRKGPAPEGLRVFKPGSQHGQHKGHKKHAPPTVQLSASQDLRQGLIEGAKPSRPQSRERRVSLKPADVPRRVSMSSELPTPVLSAAAQPPSMPGSRKGTAGTERHAPMLSTREVSSAGAGKVIRLRSAGSHAASSAGFSVAAGDSETMLQDGGSRPDTRESVRIITDP